MDFNDSGFIEYKVSLDNLTIVGEPKINAEQLRAMLISKGFIVNFWQTPYKRYNDNYTLLGGGMLQITHKRGFVDKMKMTVHQIRLEFNPNRIYDNSDLMHEYLQLLKLIHEPKITRKDIAIDLANVDMNNYSILDFAGRKRIEYKTGAMVLETLYLGAPKSEERHRIYDKALEQGIEGIKWWRVEAQLRKDKAEMMNYNPFSKVKIVYKNDLKEFDIRTRVMLYYLQANPDGFKELSINARGKYKKLLASQMEELHIDIAGMAAEAMEDLHQDILSWLNFCPPAKEKGFKVTALKSCLSEEEEKFTDKQRMELIAHIEKWVEEDAE